ncbi:MAG: Dabb family protein [Bacteroidales bacterium]|nr:Dabb family protein [Bacteroidales bacterium]
MLKHIVMIRLKDREKLQAQSRRLETMLKDLLEQIDELLSMEVGLNVSTKDAAFDLVLTAAFADEKALDAYRVHPAHVEVLDFLKETMEKATVVDYFV